MKQPIVQIQNANHAPLATCWRRQVFLAFFQSFQGLKPARRACEREYTLFTLLRGAPIARSPTAQTIDPTAFPLRDALLCERATHPTPSKNSMELLQSIKQGPNPSSRYFSLPLGTFEILKRFCCIFLQGRNSDYKVGFFCRK